jgi:SNF2 family DNA or RNA helicase
MDAAQHAEHDPALEAAKILLSKSAQYPLTFKEKAMLNGLLQKCRRAASDSRLVGGDKKSDRFQKIENLILEKVKQGEKVVVYSEWIDCLNLLASCLAQAGIKYVHFTGQLTDKAKNKNLEDFISEPEIQVFLSTDSGGLGVDGLQLAAKTVIHVEDIWNPAKLDQRNGRLVRALQMAEFVDIYYFDSHSGIEEMLKANKEGKYRIIREINQN